MATGRFADADLDRWLGHVLRAGVVLSAVVVLVGASIYLTGHAGERPHYGLFRGEPTTLRTIRGIASEASSLSGRGVVQFGLLLLIATPVARVLFSVLGFIRERDWLYAAITGLVLGLLAYSLFTA